MPRLKYGKFERREIAWLAIGLGVSLLLFAFVRLAGEVMEGDTTAFDTGILRALRQPGDLTKPIGPPWMEYALLDLTALGSTTVLGLVVLIIVGFLCLQARFRTAATIAITCGAGEVVNAIMKHAFARPRPSVVPHLREVVSSSFPSGHAMESAIVYLTLGAMLMRITDSRVAKIYCMAVATLLTLLVGVSRVYLGVHYPTDVIGGWTLGFLWASICWIVERRVERRTGVAQERDQTSAS